MNVEHLTDDQVRYELLIRTLFVTKDGKEKRRKKLHIALQSEYAASDPPSLKAYLPFGTDFGEVQQGYLTTKILLENDDRFNKDQIQHLETQICHLSHRINRLTPTGDSHEEFDECKQSIAEWVDRILTYYTANPTHRIVDSEEVDDESNSSDTKPGGHISPPKTNPSRPSMRKIPLDPCLLNSGRSSKHGPHYPYGSSRKSGHESYTNNPHQTSSEASQSESRGRKKSFKSRSKPQVDAWDECLSINSDDSDGSSLHSYVSNRRQKRTSLKHDTHTNRSLRRSTEQYEPIDTHDEHSWYAPANSVTVLKWKFHFSGLSPSEDPKGLDVERFIQKVVDYGRSERIPQQDILNKMQHLLKGPAEDWYLHARKKIDTWGKFVVKLRSRFSKVSGSRAIQQMILQKKQLPGEYTLRFIDQFVNLIDRLPYLVSEQRVLKWILGGIKPEIAILARTAHIKSVDDLSRYVKRNFGPEDRLTERYHRQTPVHSRNHRHVSVLQNFDKEVSSSDSDEDDQDCCVEEMSKMNVGKQKRKKEWAKEQKQNPNTAKHDQSKAPPEQKPQTNSHITQAPQPIHLFHSQPHTCCLHATQHFPNHINYFHNQSPEICQSTVPNNYAPRMPINSNAHEMSHNNFNSTFQCPFCKGNHSYKMCPLPPEQKFKRCFKCGALDKTANTCPCSNPTPISANNNKQMNSLNQPSPTNSTHLDLLATIPKEVYMESLIYYPTHDPRPHTTPLVNGTYLDGLLDTGAHATVIGKDLYESIEWETDLQPIETVIFTADGTTHKCLGVLLLNYELKTNNSYVSSRHSHETSDFRHKFPEAFRHMFEF